MNTLTENKTFIMVTRNFAIVVWILAASGCSYEIPEPTFERLSPGGIRVSIPDEPVVQFFAFHANVNFPIEANEDGTITGEVNRSRENRWIIEFKNITLRDKDVLHYWIYVQANGSPHTRFGDDRKTTTVRIGEMPECEQSVTVVRGKLAACRDRLVFEENFDGEIIDAQDSTTTSNSSWAREIMLPLDPDYEFCVYRELPNSLQFDNGIMAIVPLILDEVYGDNATLFGRLDLSESCTASLPLECNRRAIGHSILPPIISARLTTKQSFYFRYGKIEIRAKFPKGDWLYPELWLQPKQHTYGIDYSSGRVILGMARGNEHLTNSSSSSGSSSRNAQYGSTSLEFGLRTGSRDNIREDRVTRTRSFGGWNDDYHVYTTLWNEKGFRFQVDGEDVGLIEPGGWLNANDSGEKSGQRNNDMSPYDNEFYITVGLGTGGIRVFPDSTVSGRNPKPWRNIEAKAMLNFWRAKEQWLPSWRMRNGVTTDSHLKLDYIRVWTV